MSFPPLQGHWRAAAKAAPEAWAQIAPLYLTPGVEWVAANDRDFDSLRRLARSVKNLQLLN